MIGLWTDELLELCKLWTVGPFDYYNIKYQTTPWKLCHKSYGFLFKCDFNGLMQQYQNWLLKTILTKDYGVDRNVYHNVPNDCKGKVNDRLIWLKMFFPTVVWNEVNVNLSLQAVATAVNATQEVPAVTFCSLPAAEQQVSSISYWQTSCSGRMLHNG